MWDGGETFVPGAVGGQTDWSASGRAGTSGSEDYGLEQTLAGEINLRDHLLAQLGMDLADPTHRLIGLQLLDLPDDAGYITAALTPVASLTGCTPPRETRHAPRGG